MHGDRDFLPPPNGAKVSKISQKFVDYVFSMRCDCSNEVLEGAEAAIEILHNLGLIREECIDWDKYPDAVAALKRAENG